MNLHVINFDSFAVLEFNLDFHSWPVHTNCPAHLLHVFVGLKRLQFYFGLNVDMSTCMIFPDFVFVDTSQNQLICMS